MNTSQTEASGRLINPKKPINSDHVIDYIAQLLGELSEMAADIGNDDLADLIRFCGRAAKMEKPKFE